MTKPIFTLLLVDGFFWWIYVQVVQRTDRYQMKYYIKGLIVALVVLFPVLFYIYTFEDQKNYVVISYGW